MLRKRVHAPQLEGELTLSPALYAVGMMKPMDEPSAKRMKPDASESRYRSQLHGAATELASRRNPKTAARQEVCVECDTCPVTTPLSSLGLAKAPTQWRWRCNDCVVGWKQLKGPYVPPMNPKSRPNAAAARLASFGPLFCWLKKSVNKFQEISRLSAGLPSDRAC